MCIRDSNKTEVDGRTIKVDIANAKGGKGGGRGGNRGGGRDGDGGGKSARELQAMREEADGGKKRRRRPRPKKD